MVDVQYVCSSVCLCFVVYVWFPLIDKQVLREAIDSHRTNTVVTNGQANYSGEVASAHQLLMTRHWRMLSFISRIHYIKKMMVKNNLTDYY